MRVMPRPILEVLTALILDCHVITSKVHAMARLVIPFAQIHLHQAILKINTTIVLKVQNCIATGPGEDMFDSTRIIGEKQYTMGKVLWFTIIIGASWVKHFWHTNFLNSL